MSEVDEILKQCFYLDDGTTSYDMIGDLEKRKQALFQLLLDQAEDFDIGITLTSMPPRQVTVAKKAIPVAKLQQLFGKEDSKDE